MNITDNILHYVLHSFSKVSIIKNLEYEDYSEFNELLDNENIIGNLSYSKAFFDQDQIAYKEELANYLNAQETLGKNV